MVVQATTVASRKGVSPGVPGSIYCLTMVRSLTTVKNVC